MRNRITAAAIATMFLIGGILSPLTVTNTDASVDCSRHPQVKPCQSSPPATPTPTPIITPTPTIRPTPVPTPTSTPVVTPTPTVAPTPTPTPIPTPTPVPTATPPASCGTSLQARVDAAPSGGTINVTGCTYFQSVTIGKPLTLIGGIIDGGNSRTVGIRVTGSDVTLTNTEVRNVNAPLQHGAIEVTGAQRFKTNEVWSHNNGGSGLSISGGSGHRITGGDLSFNVQQGYHGNTMSDAIFDGIDIHDNNPTLAVDPGWEAGGGKITTSTGVTFRNNRVYRNQGPGIWFDIDGDNVLIENNDAWDNRNAAIFFEISTGAVIRGNRIRHSGFGSSSGWAWPAGILISTARDAEVYNNLVDNLAGGVGISVIYQSNRGDTPGLPRNIFVHNNNVLANDKLLGWYAPDADKSLFSTTTNRGLDNRFWDPSVGSGFEWNGSAMTIGTFAGTRGGTGSAYLTTAQKDALVAGFVTP